MMRASLVLGAATLPAAWGSSVLSVNVWTDPGLELWEKALAQVTLLILVGSLGRVLVEEALRPLRRLQREQRELAYRAGDDPFRHRGDAPGWPLI